MKEVSERLNRLAESATLAMARMSRELKAEGNLSGQELGPGSSRRGQSGMASGRVVSPRGLHCHEP
jgi:hypothetical protein